MNIKELRVGNFILFAENSTIFEVVEIDEYGVYVKNDNEEIWIDSDSFQGIDINKDWLINFGFKSGNINYDSYILKSSFSGDFLKVELKTGYVFVCDLNLCHWSDENSHIKYVHQLQNLYFALTGQELMLLV